jgi:hypothetical protein
MIENWEGGSVTQTPPARGGGETMIAYSRLTLALGVVSLCALLPGTGHAQMAQMPAVDVSAEAAGATYRVARYQALLVLDVLPLEAQVLLDGHPVGTARQLVAIGLPVSPGWHTVEISAPGFLPYAGRFVGDQHSSATAFTVTLAPAR